MSCFKLVYALINELGGMGGVRKIKGRGKNYKKVDLVSNLSGAANGKLK